MAPGAGARTATYATPASPAIARQAATLVACPPAVVTRPRASPAARRLALERGIDLSTLTGSGPGGAIISTDIGAAGATRPRAAARLDLIAMRRAIGAAIALPSGRFRTTISAVRSI